MKYAILILSIISTILSFMNAVISKSQQEKLSNILEDLTLRVHYKRPLEIFKKLKNRKLSIIIEVVNFFTVASIFGFIIYNNSHEQNSSERIKHAVEVFLVWFFFFACFVYPGKGKESIIIVTTVVGNGTTKQLLKNILIFWIVYAIGFFIILIFKRLHNNEPESFIDNLFELLANIIFAVPGILFIVMTFFYLPHVIMLCILFITYGFLELILRIIRKFLWWTVQNPRGAWVVFVAFLLMMINVLVNILKVV